MGGPAVPAPLRWRKSTFSAEANCFEVALLDDGTIAVRSSSRPADGVMVFSRDDIDAFFRGVKAGEFDDLVS